MPCGVLQDFTGCQQVTAAEKPLQGFTSAQEIELQLGAVGDFLVPSVRIFCAAAGNCSR